MNEKILRAFALSTVGGALISTWDTATAQGRYLWSERYAGASQQDDFGLDVELGDAGVVFVSGASYTGANQDAVVLAYDAYGTPLWQRQIDLGFHESAGTLSYDRSSQSLIVAAFSSGPAGSVPGSVFWRLDPQTGATLWEWNSASAFPQGADLGGALFDGANGFVASGFLGGLTTAHDAVVVRLDLNGQLSWSWQAPTAGGVFGYASNISRIPSGGFAVRTTESIAGTGSMHKLHRLDANGSLLGSVPIGSSDNGCQGPFVDGAGNWFFWINAPGIGGRQISKLDAAGNTVWSIDATSLFGPNGSTQGMALDAQGELLVFGSNLVLYRLDATGSVVWARSLATMNGVDSGGFAGLVLAENGDCVVRLRDLFAGFPAEYDVFARVDAQGNLRWTQAIRGAEQNEQIETRGMLVTATGSVLAAGASLLPGAVSRDLIVVALRGQSRSTCWGDGSALACPCNNGVPTGTPSGCVRAGTTSGVRLDDQGLASLGSDSLRFLANVALTGGVAMLIQGREAATPIAYQDGIMCLTGPLLRLYAATPNAVWLDLPPSAAPQVHQRAQQLGDQITPGSSRAYQLYVRGVSGLCAPNNGNLSNSIVIEWAP